MGVQVYGDHAPSAMSNATPATEVEVRAILFQEKSKYMIHNVVVASYA